jgi:hypothetical protein
MSAERLLADPRDTPMLRIVLTTSAIVPLAALVFWQDGLVLWLAPVYWVVWLRGLAHPMGHLLHRAIHRPVFKRRYNILNHYVYWVLSVLLGHTPTTFYVHHLAMHHLEENLPDDLSSTMRYQRDAFGDFLRYWVRFMILGTPELAAYLVRRRKKPRLAVLLVAGDLFFYGLCVGLTLWRPGPGLVVFIVPFVLTRFVLAAINWTQHVFVDPDRPDDVFTSTVTTLDAHFNAIAFNEGHHLTHHLRPGAHYTELDVDFRARAGEIGAHDAIVFDGVDFLGIWYRLMTGRHEELARHLVRLPGAPERTTDEIVALFRRRLAPIRQFTPALADAA